MEGEPKEIVNQPKEIGSQQKDMEGERNIREQGYAMEIVISLVH